MITQDWELRILTDDDEASDYPAVIHDNDSNYPSVDAVFVFTFIGWLKAFGDKDYGAIGGRWGAQSEKPTFSHFNRTVTTNVHGPKRQVWKDIKFLNNTAGLQDVHTNATDATNWILRVYGCSHNGSSNSAGSFRHGSTSSIANLGYLASQFFNKTLNPSSANGGLNSIIVLVNCYWHNTTANAINYQFSSGGGQPQKDIRVINCIFNMNGSGLLCYNNVGNTDKTGSDHRESNRFWLRGGADWAKFSDTEPILPVFTPNGQGEDFSSEGDPDIVSDADPTINDTSLILDKGSAPDAPQFAISDPTGNLYHLYDGLNFLWGDSIDASTPLSSEGNAKFSQRAVGPLQNARGMTPPLAFIASPINIISFGPVYVASKVTPDPDDTGTCQPRFLQADNSAMTSGLIIKDAWPLNLTAGDVKINFKEDGGSELTATLTTGIANTVDLLADIKAQLESAGLGTYTVTYNTGTEKLNIAVSGAVTNVQFLGATGTDIANWAYKWLGFRPIDTANQPSHDADDPTLENFYDSTLDYEYSENYDGESDPGSSGTWFALGTGDPSDSGVQGSEGVDCASGDRWVRTNLALTNPMAGKNHVVEHASGTLKSAAVGP